MSSYSASEYSQIKMDLVAALERGAITEDEILEIGEDALEEWKESQ